MNIALVLGSQSVEHEISIITAGNVYKYLKEKYNVSLLYIDKDLNFYHLKKFNVEQLKDIKQLCKKKVVLKKDGYLGRDKIDYFIPVLHGTNGEDGKIQALFDIYNCNYISHSMYSSICGHSKYLSKLILKDHNVPVLDYYRVLKKEFLKSPVYTYDRVNKLGYPVILKGTQLGSSVGVIKVETEKELFDSLLQLFEYDSEVIIEPCISNFLEVNQAVVNTGDIECSKIELVDNTDEIYTYDEKYNSYTKYSLKCLEDVELKNRITELSTKIYNIFNFKSIVRIDYLILENVIYVNEINVIPGSLSSHLFDRDLDLIIKDLLYIRKDTFKYNYKNSIDLTRVNSKKFI